MYFPDFSVSVGIVTFNNPSFIFVVIIFMLSILILAVISPFSGLFCVSFMFIVSVLFVSVFIVSDGSVVFCIFPCIVYLNLFGLFAC